ncbi:uncharacterized protein LOC132730929 [Ruditapes philippinarum]|uniref:uncharacterized protein LOC132730929 n=1 Tax=Ruditapes philippinarum TaxID=129788 RepID=UPI00295B4509|nr:uncharacterized protein LOC132730929 [Ruditapes philippinarum]
MFSKSSSTRITCKLIRRCFTSQVQTSTACSVGCIDSVNRFLDKYDTFMLDCDGVLWRGDHITPVEGISKAIEKLQSLNKRVLFVTNNSIASRLMLQQKFQSYGFDSSLENIFGNGYIAARVIRDVLKVSGKVYLVGGPGIKWELDQLGVDNVGFGVDPDNPTSDEQELLNHSFDDNIEAVLVGHDEYMSYNKIYKAASYICDPRCHFIATNNVEKGIFIGDGVNKRRMPLAGMVVNAITEVAGRKPLVVGKPNRFMLDCIVGKHCDIDFSRTVFVGDRLQTDVKFAKTNGIDSVLVLTGVGKVEDIDSNPELTPNYVMHSLSDIVH